MNPKHRGLSSCSHISVSVSSGEGDLQMANQRVPEEHAGNGLERRQDQGWREHVSAAGERENEKDLSDLAGTKRYASNKY